MFIGPIGRKVGAMVAGGALALTGSVALAGAANAASQEVDDVTFSWTLNYMVGADSYFSGLCNFMSAGKAGNVGNGQGWDSPDGVYFNEVGNVTLEKPTADGGWEKPTWDTKCLKANGQDVGKVGGTTGTRVKFSGGEGTVDAATGKADIAWDGSFTVTLYQGMTYWSATDPRLVVKEDGTGTLSATISGYASDRDDPDIWAELAPRNVALANFTNVIVGARGITATPDYRGVEVETGAKPQVREGKDWGSFPQSFIDFQQLTGQSSYWYSSNSNDWAKVATPAYFTWDKVAGPYKPAVRVSQSTLAGQGETEITVKGFGFDPTQSIATEDPLNGRPGGVRVAFGKFGSDWKPSAGIGSEGRPGAKTGWAVLEDDMDEVGGLQGGAIRLTEDGDFEAVFTVSKKAADQAAALSGLAGGEYGIYTYAGGGAVTEAFETFTPLSFDSDIAIGVDIPTQGETEEPGEFSWEIQGTPTIALGEAKQNGTIFRASGQLPTILVTDTRETSPSWSLRGQVTDFTAGEQTFDGGYLGWRPFVNKEANTGGAWQGGEVAPGKDIGLDKSKALAIGPAGHPRGTSEIGADMNLQIPIDVTAGHYAAVLTITAVG
jgi:hypothetical protein